MADVLVVYWTLSPGARVNQRTDSRVIDMTEDRIV
jgi:hypothetical protein